VSDNRHGVNRNSAAAEVARNPLQSLTPSVAVQPMALVLIWCSFSFGKAFGKAFVNRDSILVDAQVAVSCIE
jgi:hypothetical protein